MELARDCVGGCVDNRDFHFLTWVSGSEPPLAIDLLTAWVEPTFLSDRFCMQFCVDGLVSRRASWVTSGVPSHSCHSLVRQKMRWGPCSRSGFVRLSMVRCPFVTKGCTHGNGMVYTAPWGPGYPVVKWENGLLALGTLCQKGAMEGGERVLCHWRQESLPAWHCSRVWRVKFEICTSFCKWSGMVRISKFG